MLFRLEDRIALLDHRPGLDEDLPRPVPPSIALISLGDSGHDVAHDGDVLLEGALGHGRDLDPVLLDVERGRPELEEEDVDREERRKERRRRGPRSFSAAISSFRFCGPCPWQPPDSSSRRVCSYHQDAYECTERANSCSQEQSGGRLRPRFAAPHVFGCKTSTVRYRTGPAGLFGAVPFGLA